VFRSRAVQNGRNLFVRKDLWKQVVPETRLRESEYFKISQKTRAPARQPCGFFW